ncbi:hypothetical protein GCM10029963_34910 [Micromonospora andamanensis]
MRVDEQSTDPIDQILGELPVPTPLTPEDVRLAVRAVVVHAAEEWPSGALCRNDGARFPCRLHRWGRQVLLNHGLNERQLDALIRHGNPFVHVPFPFLINGPSAGRTPPHVRRAPTVPPDTRRGPPVFRCDPTALPVTRVVDRHPGWPPRQRVPGSGHPAPAGRWHPRHRAALAAGELRGARPPAVRRRPGARGHSPPAPGPASR